MFFCEKCREKNDWPDSIMKSFGKCEVCGEHASCNDVPSRALPNHRPEPLVQEARKTVAKTQRRDANGNPIKTQLARACALVGRLDVPDAETLRRLDNLLDEAQNAPPHGRADGSLHEKKFNRLRAMVHAGRAFLAAYTTALED
jgi:hypothetical protein